MTAAPAMSQQELQRQACARLIERPIGTISAALDGDTFVVRGCHIRIPGVSAPESWDGSDTARRQARRMGLTMTELTAFGARSEDYARAYVGAAAIVTVIPANEDIGHIDAFGRLLADLQVYDADRNTFGPISLRLVLDGYALAALDWLEDERAAQSLLLSEQVARMGDGFGLWSDPSWRRAVARSPDARPANTPTWERMEQSADLARGLTGDRLSYAYQQAGPAHMVEVRAWIDSVAAEARTGPR